MTIILSYLLWESLYLERWSLHANGIQEAVPDKMCYHQKSLKASSMGDQMIIFNLLNFRGIQNLTGLLALSFSEILYDALPGPRMSQDETL